MHAYNSTSPTFLIRNHIRVLWGRRETSMLKNQAIVSSVCSSVIHERSDLVTYRKVSDKIYKILCELTTVKGKKRRGIRNVLFQHSTRTSRRNNRSCATHPVTLLLMCASRKSWADFSQASPPNVHPNQVTYHSVICPLVCGINVVRHASSQ